MKQYPAYPAYKTTGCDWFPQIPSHWGIDRAKWSVSSCQNGVWGADPDGDDDLVCIRVADFDRQSLRVSTEKLTMRSIAEKDRRNRLLKNGDLLLEKSGGGDQQLVGAVVEFSQPFPAVSSNFIARMVAGDEMNPRFLVYLHSHLYSGRVNFRSIKQTTGIQNLDSQAYLDEPITYPPLDEQQTIARFLDFKTAQIDALIAKKKALLDKLAEKRTALISHAVTKGLDPTVPMKDSGVAWLGEIPTHWNMTRLKYATCMVVDCPHDTPVYSDDGDYPVVRTADLFQGKLDLAKAYRVEYAEYRHRVRRAVVNAHDILYGREGERWGFAATVPESPKVCLGQRMMQFRTSDQFHSRFLMWHLNADCVYQQGALDVAGSTAPHVNVETIKNYWLVEPPLHEQVQIADFLNKATDLSDCQVTHVARVIDRLIEYRSALITNAVTGKIDVRGFEFPASAEAQEPAHA